MGRGRLCFRPTPWLTAAAMSLIAAACAAPLPEPEPAAAPPAAGAQDPAAPAAPADPADAKPGAPIVFADDPLAGAPMAVPDGVDFGAGGAGGMTELAAPPPEPEFNEDLIDRSSELGLQVLRARFVAEELGRASRVLIPEGPFRFGEIVPIRFELRNPLGETVTLLPPASGLVLELSWEVSRWLPVGGHDKVVRNRWYRLSDRMVLESDETYATRSEIPLVMDGDPGALWQVRVDARLRCAGVLLGERELPVHRVEYRSNKLHAFPAGWESLREDPLHALELALANPRTQADRHVLVATALLTGAERYEGLERLVDSLRKPVSPTRALSAAAALQWLTQLPLGETPEDWIRWHDGRTLASQGPP